MNLVHFGERLKQCQSFLDALHQKDKAVSLSISMRGSVSFSAFTNSRNPIISLQGEGEVKNPNCVIRAWSLFLWTQVVFISHFFKADSQWYHGDQLDLRVPPHPSPVSSQHSAHHGLPCLPRSYWKPSEWEGFHEGQHPDQQQYPLQGMSCSFTELKLPVQMEVIKAPPSRASGQQWLWNISLVTL